MKRKLLYILLIFTMLGMFGLFYVNKYFLPVKLKTLIVEKAAQQFNRKVTLDSIQYKFPLAMSIRDLAIYDADSSKIKFATVEEINFNVLFAPIFKSKNIIIPTLSIKNPQFFINKNENNTWNFDDLTKSKSTEKSDYNVLIKKVNISNGQCEIVSNVTEDSIYEKISNINISTNISLEKELLFDIEATSLQSKSDIKATGTYIHDKKSITSDLSLTNFNVPYYINLFASSKYPYLKRGKIDTKDSKLTLKQNTLSIEGLVNFKNIEYSKDNTSFFADLTAQNLSASTFDQGIQLGGTFSIPWGEFFIDDQALQAKMDFDLEQLNIKQNNITLDGSIDISNAILQNNKTKILETNITLKDISLKYLNKNLNLSAHKFIVGNFAYNKDNIEFLGNLEDTNINVTYKEDSLHYIGTPTYSDGIIKIEDKLDFNGKLVASKFELTHNKESLDININSQLSKARIKSADQYEFNGSPEISLSLNQNRIDNSLTFKGDATFNNSKIINVPTIKEIEEISGKLSFNNENISLNKLTASLLNNKVSLNGKIRSLDKPTFKGTIESPKFNLSSLTNIEDQFPTLKQMKISGSSSILIQYDGELKDYTQAKILLDSTLKNVNLLINEDTKFENLEGILKYDLSTLTISSLRGIFKNNPFLLEGSIKNFSTPLVIATIKTNDFDIDTELNFDPLVNEINLKSLSAQYIGSTIKTRGLVNIANKNNPIISLNGNLSLDTRDLQDFIPEKNINQFNKLNLEGTINTDFTISGPALKISDLNINANGHTNKLYAAGYPFEELIFVLKTSNQKIEAFNINSKLYDGNLEIKTIGNLDNDLNFSTKALIKDLNLKSYQSHKNTNIKLLSGMLSFYLELEGPLKRKDMLKGKGAVLIANGYLGQIIKEFQQTYFTDVEGNFEIMNSKIHTENAKVFSQSASLNIKGWMDFDQNIDFKVVPIFNQAPKINAGGGLKIDPTMLLTEALDIRLTGTLSNPKKQVSKSASKVLGNTTEIIRDGIGDIIGGLGDLF